MSASIDALLPELQPPCRALLDLATRAGVGPKITSTLRSHAEQTRLYRRYVAGNAPYPVAPPGASAHEYGYAFDLVVNGEQNQIDLGHVWEDWGGVWGGHAHDPIHFEYPGFKLATSTGDRGASCSGLTKGIAEAVDFVLGFAPGIGQAELVAFLLSLGFPHSSVLQYIQNPVTSFACGTR